MVTRCQTPYCECTSGGQWRILGYFSLTSITSTNPLYWRIKVRKNRQPKLVTVPGPLLLRDAHLVLVNQPAPLSGGLVALEAVAAFSNSSMPTAEAATEACVSGDAIRKWSLERSEERRRNGICETLRFDAAGAVAFAKPTPERQSAALCTHGIGRTRRTLAICAYNNVTGEDRTE